MLIDASYCLESLVTVYFFLLLVYLLLAASESQLPSFKALWQLKNHIQNADFISHQWAASFFFLTLKVFSLSDCIFRHLDNLL